MDLLDKYKQAWSNQAEDEQKISRDEIFKMMHAKSSSIVKWIFYIGLFEFLLFTISYCFVDFDKVMVQFDKLDISYIMWPLQVIFLAIFLYFLFLFYKNYKKISVKDNTKTLVTNIIKTRKTVKHYILFNLISAAISFFIIIIAKVKTTNAEMSQQEMISMAITSIITSVITIALFWLLYQLLYGILLKKLRRNHQELIKLDASN